MLFIQRFKSFIKELAIAARQNTEVINNTKLKLLSIPNKLQILPIKFCSNKLCGLESTVKNGITVAREKISAKPAKKVTMNDNKI